MKKRRLKNKVLYNLIPILIIFFLFLGAFGIYKFVFQEKDLLFLEQIESSTYANITHYAIYGIHMNIEGNITLNQTPEQIDLVLANAKTEKKLNWELTQENNKYSFSTSNYINEGINLENLPQENLYLLIKTIEKNENNEIVTKYYSVENESNYQDLEYYTLTKNNKNNKIDIEWNTYEECPTLRFKIKEATLPNEVYDITIDPGHDARDPGKAVCSNGYDPDWSGKCQEGTLYKESDLNLITSLKLKSELEKMGYKVAMTRETEEDEVNIYDSMGSATMANDTKSKFNLAIHHNSSGINGGDYYLKGLEIYIANDTNIDFAKNILSEIIINANTQASPKKQYLVEPGIYQRFFTEDEILDDTVQPSNKTTNTIYYYNLREIGGISTNASNDGRYAPYYPKNEHYNSNNTAESYLLELGYMDNVSELENIVNNSQGYATGIASAIQKYLEQEK